MARVCLVSLFIFSCLFLAKADECVSIDFEDGSGIISSTTNSFCAGYSSWSVGTYGLIGLESPDGNSSIFITPATTLSCWSSADFTVALGGSVEIHAYTGSDAPNQISILAFQSVTDGTDTMVSASQTEAVSGWQTVRIDFFTAINPFQGYIVLLSTASPDSLILVNSVKYSPLNVQCEAPTEEVEEDTTTEGNVDETTTEANGEDTAAEEDVCVTYDFESDFEVRFTPDNYLCDGLQFWQLDNYTNIDVESPNEQSTAFMSPNELTSCISSFVFRMSPGGIVEANVYMDPISSVDHIIVLAQKVTGREYDTVAGFKMYYPANQVFVTGWNVLRFTLVDSESFNGYLIFIGGAADGSTVLVDSLRYIPPTMSADDESCALYRTETDAVDPDAEEPEVPEIIA